MAANYKSLVLLIPLCLGFFKLLPVGGTFSPSPYLDVCPGGVAEFTCTVEDDDTPEATLWIINGTTDCLVFNNQAPINESCDALPAFQIALQSPVGNSYTSVLNTGSVFVALNNTAVECRGPSTTTVVGNSTLRVIAPPTAPSFLPLSPSDFTDQDSGLQVTLHWTAPVVYPQPSDAAVSRYVITSDQAGTCAQGGCVVSPGGPGFSQREYTLENLPLSQEYTFTVRADNCEMGDDFQTGMASDGLVLSLQLPAMPACSSVPVYDSNDQLVSIETNWTTVVGPVSEVAPNVSGDVADYVLRIAEVAQSTEVLDPSEVCGVSGCSYRVNNAFAGDSGQYTVILQARNIVGTGLQGQCGTIGLMNTIVDVTPRTTDASSPVVQCVFSQLAPGSVASCTVCFGTDRSSLLDCSSSVGSTGEVTDSSIYTVRCELQSESTASTQWIIDGVTCSLPHTLAPQYSMELCGPGSVQRVTSDTDTEGTYVSEFRFIPMQEVNGLEVKCFATSNQDFVYSGRVKIVGSPSAPTINNLTVDDIQSNRDSSSAMVTISWELGSDTAEVSRYVVQVTPSISDCPDEGCVLRRDNVGFFNRTLDLHLPVGYVFTVTVSSDSSCDTVVGARSDPFKLNLNVPEAVESCNTTVNFSRNNIPPAIKLNFSRLAETPDIARGVPGLTHYVVAVNGVRHTLAETNCYSERCLYQILNFQREDLFAIERLSVVAENVFGLSDVTTCIPTSQTIGYSNNLLSVHVDVVGKKAVCTFPSNWRGDGCSLTIAGATYTGSIVDGDDNVTIDLTPLSMGLHDDYRPEYFATATDGQLTVFVDGVVTGNGSLSGLSIGIAVGSVLLIFILLVVVIIRVLVCVVVMRKHKKEKGKRTSEQDGDHPRDAEKDGLDYTTPTAKTFLKGSSDGSGINTNPIAHAVAENGDHAHRAIGSTPRCREQVADPGREEGLSMLRRRQVTLHFVEGAR